MDGAVPILCSGYLECAYGDKVGLANIHGVTMPFVIEIYLLLLYFKVFLVSNFLGWYGEAPLG